MQSIFFSDACTNFCILICNPLNNYFVSSICIGFRQDLCKRAAVLTNKVMKHGFVGAMEDILDADKKITHEKLATQVCLVTF